MTKKHIVQKALSKAAQSLCRFKISAIGMNKKGEVVYSSTNKSRFNHKGGGLHAEMQCMLKAGKALKVIYLLRTNGKGHIMRIAPCSRCSNKARKLGIKIISIKP